MDLIQVAAPAILPSFAGSFAARLSNTDPTGHFDAGRACAREALAQLGPGRGDAVVSRGDAGQPLWPHGVVGSITHTRDIAWAAAALTTHAAGIGIDIEPIRSAERAARVAELVLLPGEDPPTAAFTTSEWVALVLSIKESTFKCLYPLVGRRFYFEALRVTAADRHAGTFDALLLASLSATFTPGFRLTGRFSIDDHTAATAVILPAEAPPARADFSADDN